MKRIGTWMACGALTLAFSACDNGRTTDPDGGPIVLSDGGSDSGTPVMVDAGTDAGSMPTGCTVTVSGSLPPLPEACLPRCAAATASALNACTTAGGTPEEQAMCQRTAVANDTTPGTTIDVVGVGAQPLDCEGCWDWGINHCIGQSCSAELAACAGCGDQCDPMTAGCEAEETAINNCLMANQSTINECFQPQAMGCF